MAKKTFAVMGATGQVGRPLLDALLGKGHRVRAIGRDFKKLEALRAKGAQTFPAAFDDASRLSEAFFGCEAVFAMIPPEYGAEDPGACQDRIGESIRDAAARSGVRKIVSLSSIGAQHASGTGPVKGLYRQEQRLNALGGLDVVHLRPCYFMQNFYWAAPAIRERGVVVSALKSNQAMWMVSTNDIGWKAAELLEGAAFEGKSAFELVGPRQLAQAEAVGILAQALGRPELKYVQASYDEQEKALLGAGMSRGLAGLFVEMQKGFNEGLFATTQELTAEHKGTATFETFAREFAQAFKGQPVGV